MATERTGTAEEWNQHGNALQGEGKFEEAVEAYRQALALEPGHARAMSNMGVALAELNRSGEAIEKFRQALALDPAYSAARLNLAKALGKLDLWAEAEEQTRQALLTDPTDPEVLVAAGVALAEQQRSAAAADLFRRALQLAPENVPARLNLSVAQTKLDEWEAAEENCRQVLRQEPDNIPALVNFSVILGQKEDDEGMLAYLDQALALEPDSAMVHVYRAWLWLRKGKLREGFAEYEWRRDWDGHPRVALTLTQPLWRNEPASTLGGALLILWEDGYGDTFQFCRYVLQLAEEGHQLLCQTSPDMVSFFRESLVHPQIRFLASDENVDTAGGLKPVAYTSYVSLPFYAGTDLDTIPARIPYLRAAAVRVENWGKRLDSLLPPGRWWRKSAKPFKVGMVWAGNPEHKNDAKRSLNPDLLAPLLRQEGVVFFSLQKEKRGHGLPPGPIIDLSAQIESFSDTAAIIENLDLVIAVDTSVAHLAGALGKPVWIMLAYHAEWRWLEKREDSPWYPTARLFRQPAQGDWAAVVTQVGKALRQRVEKRHKNA